MAQERRLKNEQAQTVFPLRGPQKKVIPWPTSQVHEIADPVVTNVQIAIEDQAYAEELRGLLEADNKHRAHIVDRPISTLDGVVVLDETTLGHVAVLEENDALRYIVLFKESFDPDKLWQTGIQYAVPAQYPADLVRIVILGTELRLSIKQSPKVSVPQTEEY
jgi:hypothetical protein